MNAGCVERWANKTWSTSTLFMQGGHFCSLRCVFLAPCSSHWGPTSKGPPICCYSCSSDESFLERATALWPVSRLVRGYVCTPGNGNVLKTSSFWSLSVVQQRITAMWFKDKELSLAFGLTVGCSRLGSVMNFFITQSFEEQYGMQWTLWGGKSLTWPC